MDDIFSSINVADIQANFFIFFWNCSIYHDIINTLDVCYVELSSCEQERKERSKLKSGGIYFPVSFFAVFYTSVAFISTHFRYTCCITAPTTDMTLYRGWNIFYSILLNINLIENYFIKMLQNLLSFYIIRHKQINYSVRLLEKI